MKLRYCRTTDQLKLNKSTAFYEACTDSLSPDKPVALGIPDQIGIWKCWFLWREENPRIFGKNSKEDRQPITNSTQIWNRVRESNPGHIGGRRALSPVRYPCYPSYGFISYRMQPQEKLHLVLMRKPLLPELRQYLLNLLQNPFENLSEQSKTTKKEWTYTTNIIEIKGRLHW